MYDVTGESRDGEFQPLAANVTLDDANRLAVTAAQNPAYARVLVKGAATGQVAATHTYSAATAASAISAYRSWQYARARVDRLEQQLHAAVGSLTAPEFDAYARETAKIDADADLQHSRRAV